MHSVGRWITFSAIALSFLWAGSALGKPPGKPPGKERPKNIIIMIGDGMGPEQVESGRLLRLLDPDGVFWLDVMDPEPGWANTLNVFGETTDSAASATALATGVKTANGNVSMAEDDVTELPTSMEAAQEKGMATGILSSVYLCDATPGVWLAHAPRRTCSIIIPDQHAACPDVFLGSGHTEFVVFTKPINWIDKMVENCNYELVETAEELAAAEARDGRLMGMWGGYTITYDIDRQHDLDVNDPTLAQMTEKAIEVLSRDRDGFFLMVEGGAIDWMAHNRDIAGTARDVVAFDDAVAKAYDFAEADGETLLVVTADHETAGLVVGDNPNMDFVRGVRCSTDFMWGHINEIGADQIVEQCLPGLGVTVDAVAAAIDPDAGGCDNSEIGLSRLLSEKAGVDWFEDFDQLIRWDDCDEGSHTDTEVPVFAFGPGSESLEGDIDNTDIGKLLFDVVNGN
jgi:alkaline phosphatase